MHIIDLIKGRILREAHERNQPAENVKAVLDELDGQWREALLQFHRAIQEINLSHDHTPRGKSKRIAEKQQELIQKIEESTKFLGTIEKTVSSLEGEIINAVARALGVARVMDPTEKMIEFMREQEARSLWMYQQARSDADHDAMASQAAKDRVPLSDQQRSKPNVIKEQFLATNKSFKNDDGDTQEANRIVVNAVRKSLVPLVDAETLRQGEELLRRSVAPERVAAKETAICVHSCLDLLYRELRNAAQNPQAIRPYEEPWSVPVSDQDRMKAAA